MKVCQIFLPLLILFLTANLAMAQGSSPGYIVDEVAAGVSIWQTNMAPAIRKLFFLLMGLDFAWMAVRLALKQGTLEEWASTFVRKIFFYGFGLALLQFGGTWARYIIDSFFKLAGIAGGRPNMGIYGIWDLGIQTVTAMYENLSFWDGVGFVLFLGLAILSVIALSAYISAVLVLAYCETYIVLGAGTVILGLSGSEWTKGYAQKYLHFAIMSGMKLFITLLIGQLGMVLIGSWVEALKGGTLAEIAEGLGAFLVFTVLISKIPGTITGMMSGAGIQGSESLVSGSMKMAGAAAVTAATGGAAAVATAAKLSKAEGSKGVLGMAGGTVKNLAGSFADDMKGSFSSKNKDLEAQPSQGHRMSKRMEDKMDSIKAKQADSSGANSVGAGSGKDGKEGSQGKGKDGDKGAGATGAAGAQGSSDAEGGNAEGGNAEGGNAEGGNAGGGFDPTGDNMADSVEGGFDPTGDNMGGQSAPQVGGSSMGGQSVPISSSGMGSSPAPQSAPQASPVSNAGAVVGSAPVGSTQNTAFDNTGDNMQQSEGASKIAQLQAATTARKTKDYTPQNSVTDFRPPSN